MLCGVPGPQPDDIGGGCTVYLNQLGSLLGSLSGGGATYPRLRMYIPDEPTLAGARFTLQAMVHDVSIQPFGFGLTNAVDVQLGFQP